MASKSKFEDLRASFLRDSSRLLAATSPSTSSYLSSERTSAILSKGPSPNEDIRRETCMACGAVSIVGWTASITRVFQKHEKMPVKKPVRCGNSRPAQRRLSRICLSCHRKTVSGLVPAARSGKAFTASSRPSSGTNPALAGETELPPRVEQASGKRRAKARKEGSSLRALLNNSKANSTIPASLDLMDFLMPQST